jgi:multiple sugar transport system substrate-binding protein
MNETFYTRRQICQLGLGTLTSLTMLNLAACGDSAKTSSSSTIDLQLSFWGSTNRNQLTQNAIAAYTKDDHPNVTFHTWFTGDLVSYFKKLDTQAAAGTLPDLIEMDMSYVKQYADKKHIMDMSSLLSNKTIDLSDFDQTLLDDSTYNNILYGIPMGGSYTCMIYNSAIVQQAGVGTPPAVWTWDEYASYASKLSQALSSRQIFGSPDASDALDIFEIWVRQNGRELYTADGKVGFTQDDITTWFEYWNGMRLSGACAPAQIQALASSGTQATSLLIKGKSAFATGHSNQFTSYQKLATDKLEFQLLPTGKQPGNYFKPAALISIASTSKNTQEAANFIEFISTNPKGVNALSLDHGVPGSARAVSTLKSTDKATGQNVMAYADLVTKNGQSRPKMVLDPFAAKKVQMDMLKTAQSVRVGQLSPTDGGSQFLQNAQKTLAEA